MPVLRMLLWRLFEMTSNLHPLSTFPDMYTYSISIYIYTLYTQKVPIAIVNSWMLYNLYTSNRIIPSCWLCQNPTQTEAATTWMNGYPNNMRKYLDFFIPHLSSNTTPKRCRLQGSCVGESLSAFSRYRYGIGIFACDTNAIYSPSNGTRSGSTHETGE